MIAADCPWQFGDSLPGETRGAAKNYATMTVPALMRYPLPPIADDALLFFWRVSSMPQAALDIVRAWDFEPKTELVWVKTTSQGKMHFGMGRILRGAHETCLVAARGSYARNVLDKGIRTVLIAAVGQHSEKPDAFYDLVERLYPGPRCELFARRAREGWEGYGLELHGEPSHP